MGITAENVAKKFGISRADQDAFALRSQQKAAAALKASVFDAEIVPVKATRYEGGKRVEVEFKRDELPRGDTTARGARRAQAVVREGRHASRRATRRRCRTGRPRPS